MTTLLSLIDSGINVPEEDLPQEPPYATRYLWEIFCDLTHTRDSGMGISGIKYSEITAYCSIINCRLTEWEVSVVMGLDKKYISVYNSIREEKDKAAKANKTKP